MFTSGLLILTQPLSVLRSQIPSVLSRASQLVSDTLYVHLEPVKGDNSKCRILQAPVPVTQDLRTVVKEIYTIGSRVCRKLDIRVLLNHISNSESNMDPYTLQKGYNVVIVDNPSTSKELVSNQGSLLQCVKSSFLTNVDVPCQVLDVQVEMENTTKEDSKLKTYRNVVLGGTFDRMHVGHKILLSEGCMLAENSLTVGVSEGKMNDSKLLSDLIEPLSTRTTSVTDFIKDVKPSIIPDVVTIFDGYGPTITNPDYQCIVLSEETRSGGDKIKTKREEKGFTILDQVVIDLVIDDDHLLDEEDKVSSSSLRRRILGTLMQEVPKKSLTLSPYRIGMTGGIASGKSSVCKRLEKLGAGIVDCDKLGHECYKPGTAAFVKIVEEFGNEVVDSSGEIDRRKLGGIVFSDKSRLEKLNEITWPEIMKLAEAAIAKMKERGVEIVILDAAVLLEAEWDKNVHEVWTTFVPRAEAVQRLMKRNNLPEEAAVKRLDAQISNKESLAQANVCLCTLWEYDFTQKQCEKAWALLLERLSTSKL